MDDTADSPSSSAPEAEMVVSTLPLEISTGDPRVDAAVAQLQGLDSSSVDEHPAVFSSVHEELHAALNTLDQD